VQTDYARHREECKLVSVLALDERSPFDQWRDENPTAFALLAMFLGSQSSNAEQNISTVIVLTKGQRALEKKTWEQIKTHFGESTRPSILHQIQSRRNDQWNIVVLGYDKIVFHVRVSFVPQ
jgi:hypothetical protein